MGVYHVNIPRWESEGVLGTKHSRCFQKPSYLERMHIRWKRQFPTFQTEMKVSLELLSTFLFTAVPCAES